MPYRIPQPETRALVLVKGGRNCVSGLPTLLEHRREQRMTEGERATQLAAELRLVIVARASARRLQPSAILYAVARVLGMLAATAVRERGRLDRLVKELDEQVRDAANQTFQPGEAS